MELHHKIPIQECQSTYPQVIPGCWWNLTIQKLTHIISIYTNHQPETLEFRERQLARMNSNRKNHTIVYKTMPLDLSLNRYHIIITYGTSVFYLLFLDLFLPLFTKDPIFLPSFNFPTPPHFHNEGKRELNSLELHSLHIDCWDTSLSKSKLLRANNITQSISSPKDGKVYLACKRPPQASVVCSSQSSCRDNALHKLLMHFLIWYSTQFLSEPNHNSLSTASFLISVVSWYLQDHVIARSSCNEEKPNGKQSNILIH